MAGKESADWIRQSREINGNLFSELDVLLRALDRFFSLEYLPPSNDVATSRNFVDELEAAKNTILRVVDILEAVIPENKKNEYWFRKFAETKFLPDWKRDRLRAEMYNQDTPEKSLFLLYDSFINIKTIVGDLLKTGAISYVSFKHIGQLACNQIRENEFFNPFKHDVDPAIDFIINREISGLVRNIEDRDERKSVSVIFLHLFRFLRYMGHMNFATSRQVSLHSSLLILMLLRSEIDLFRMYLERISEGLANQELKGHLEALSYQFAMESKRVFLQELKNIFEKKSPKPIRGSIENSHGILKNLTEQTIIQLVHFWKPDLKNEEIFEMFTTKTAQSLKLREDISALHRLISLFERDSRWPEKRHETLRSLLNYLEYFEGFTFRLLRYDDYEGFSKFLNDIRTAVNEGESFEDLLDRCRHFKIFLETTLRQVGNRSELKDRPVDVEHVEDIVRQYISTT